LANPEIRATFILRLWRERDTPPGEWRAEVSHVQTARLERFGRREDLLAFVEAQLAALERGELDLTEALP
jgi:hypothetical protein